MRTASKRAMLYVLAFLFALCAAAAVMFAAPATRASAEEGTEKDATAIEYGGGSTGVYSLEHYAGFEGTYWILDNNAATVTAGTPGRRLGSGTGNNRDVTITLKVNSTLESGAQAYLRLYAQFYETGSTATVTVNGTNIRDDGGVTNLYTYNGNRTSTSETIPTSIPVTLQNGENTIVLDMQNDYNAWMEGFEIAEQNAVVSTAREVSVAPYTALEYINSPQINNTAWGGEFSDAEYKAAKYAVYVEDAGAYRLNVQVEAGDAAKNRGQILLDGNKVHTEDYYAFSTESGWGTPHDNVMSVELTEGLHTLEIRACNVESAGNNIWIKGIVFTPAAYITVDASAAKTTGYNPYDTVDTTGVVVTFVDAENEINEPVTEGVSFDPPALTGVASYPVEVVYTRDGVQYFAEYTVSTTGEMQARDAKAYDYDGTDSGQIPLYGPEQYVGFSSADSASGIVWINKLLDSPLVGWEIGSGRDDGRQLTMTFVLNVAEASDVIFTLYGNTDYGNETADDVVVKLGEDTIYEGALHDTAEVRGVNVFEVSLAEGANTLTVEFQTGYNAWLQAFSVAPVPEATLTLDTSDVKTTYIYEEELDLSGLTATFNYDGAQTPLAFEDLTIDSTAFNNQTTGSYVIQVSYTDANEVTATGQFSVTVTGDGRATEASEVSYDGTGFGEDEMIPFFGEGAAAGLGGTEGSMYWIGVIASDNDPDRYPSRYEIGSQSGDGRRLVITFKINSSVAGNVTLNLYGRFYAAGSSRAKLSVNDNDTQLVLFEMMNTDDLAVVPIEFAVAEGVNTITLTFNTGYDGWMRGWTLSDVETPSDPGENPGGDPGEDPGENPGEDPGETPEAPAGGGMNGGAIASIVIAAVVVVAGVIVAVVLVRKKKNK